MLQNSPSSNKHVITIATNPKWRPMRLVASTLFVVVVIGFGALLDSAAMQWVGFIVVIMSAIGVTLRDAGKATDLTIEEARDYIDMLEARERGTPPRPMSHAGYYDQHNWNYEAPTRGKGGTVQPRATEVYTHKPKERE